MANRFERFFLGGAVAGLLGCSAGSADTPSATGGASGSASAGAASGGMAPLVVSQAGAESNGGSGSETCASDTHQADAVPIAMYILLDQSGSMTLGQDRWTPVTSALKAFVGGPSLGGLGMGLQYFPLGATKTEDPVICQAGNYALPAVAVADLPANAGAVVASIDAHHFSAAEGEDAAH